MNIIVNTLSIYKILFVSLLLRLLLFPFFSDSFLENEWGVIFHNLKTSGVLGYNVVVNEYLAIPKLAEVGEKVLPSVFMPPLYTNLIFTLDLFFGDFIKTVNLVIFFQIFLSLASILMFYEILKVIKIEKNTLILSFIFAFFHSMFMRPANFICHITNFLIVMFFLFLFRYENNNSLLNLSLFSLVSGL